VRKTDEALAESLDLLAERAYNGGNEDVAFLARFISDHVRSGRTGVIIEWVKTGMNVNVDSFLTSYFGK
jgi:hypothetical protein